MSTPPARTANRVAYVLLVVVLSYAVTADADHNSDHHHGMTTSPSESQPPLLREYVPGLADAMRGLPAFFRDTQVNLRLRTFYLNRENADSSANEAWTAGGWLEYRSGWLADVFRLGAVGYTSQPLYAPDTRDGTLLLGPQQSPLLVMGQAYAQLRYQEYALLTGYRQLVDQGYTNPHDDRIIPNTFEGATLAGTLGPVEYFLGYLTAMKERGSDEFINMAARAGVPNHVRGQLLTSARLASLPGLSVYVANYLVPDVFNTAYLDAEYTYSSPSAWSAQLGLQLTDQRSTGERFLGKFSTWNVGARVQLHWRGLSLIAAMSATGPDAALRTPYGGWPGYLHMMTFDFDRANEKAWALGASYDWGGGTLPGPRIPGLSMLLIYAQGDGAHDPVKRASLPTRREGDIDIIWRSRSIKGLQYRFRNSYIDVGGPRTEKEFRIYFDYDLPLL